MKNLTFNSLVTSPQTRAISDSGCTSHFLGANNTCTNKIATTNGILVGLPGGDNTQATHTALLPFPQISLAALRANIFPVLQNRALISTGNYVTTVSMLPSARIISHWSSKISPSLASAIPEMVYITSTLLLACNPLFETLYLYTLLTHTAPTKCLLSRI